MSDYPSQSDSLTGGRIGPNPPEPRPGILSQIDSILKALAGTHTQVAEDIANDRAPNLDFEALLGLLPMTGGVRTPSFSSGAMSGRQLRNINSIEDWLNQSGIQYNINMNRSNSNSVYIYARHPHTNEQVAIRVPRDGHIGLVDQRSVAKYKETNRPGNFFDTGHTITRTDRPLQPEFIGNAAGEPYHNLETLFDALSHRFSRNPSGQFLVSPGREPHYPSERITPIPMTQPPIAYGTRGIVRRGPPNNTLGPTRRVVLPPRQMDLFR